MIIRVTRVDSLNSRADPCKKGHSTSLAREMAPRGNTAAKSWTALNYNILVPWPFSTLSRLTMFLMSTG